MPNPKSRRARGVAEILLSGVAFGFLGVFGKGAYAAGLSPGELLSLRFLIASAAMALYLVVTRGRGALRLTGEQLVSCAVLGLFGYAVFSSCYFLALQGLSASLTVLLLYLYPALVTAGAWFFFGERLRGWQILSLPLSFAGMLLLVWQDLSVENARSLAFGVASAVFYAFYILVSRRRLERMSPLTSSLYIQLFAGLGLAAIYLHRAPRVAEMVRVAWPSLLAVSLISTVLAMSLFLAGLQKLRASEASILSAAEPLTAILAAGFFLGERMVALQWVGALCVLLALVLVSKSSRPAESIS